jgi:hypothetical protein
MTLTIALPSAVTAFALKFTRPQPPLHAVQRVFDERRGSTTFRIPFSGSSSPFVSTTPFNTITLSVPEDASRVVENVTSGTATSVPEPASGAMMLIAFGGLDFASYRGAWKRSAAA